MPDRHLTREAHPSDRLRLSRMLAAAFQNDPVMAFIFPDPAIRRARLPGFFKVILSSDMAQGACYATAGGEAATIWRRPGRGHLSLAEMIRQAGPWIVSARTALPRALIFSAASDTAHPEEPHWYLHVAGCDPAAQGKGFGTAAIRAGLARADAGGVPAYLETATESNLGFYASLGFEVTKEWDVRRGPHCWSMMRPVPRA